MRNADAMPTKMITKKAWARRAAVSTRGRYGSEKEGAHDVCRRGDGRQATGADVDGEGNEGAQERAELEDGPENGERLALVLFERVGHHDGALRRPEERGGDSEEGAGEDEEPSRALGPETGGGVSA